MDDLIRKENMQIGVEAASWQDAVRGAGNLLLQAGSITAQYIEEMIQAVVELGPYARLRAGTCGPLCRSAARRYFADYLKSPGCFWQFRKRPGKGRAVHLL